MSSQPIPIIITGKPLPGYPERPAELAANLKPRYEVVRFCLGADAFIAEFPGIMSGEAGPPSSGVGSENPRKPVAAVVGGGISDEDVQRMKAVKGTDTMKWVRLPMDTMARLGPRLDGLERELLARLDELNLV